MKVVLVAAAGCCDCCFHCFPFVSCHKAKRGSGVSLVKNQRKNFFSDFSKIFPRFFLFFAGVLSIRQNFFFHLFPLPQKGEDQERRLRS